MSAQKIFCTACRQRLSVPTDDLTLSVMCPRCHTRHELAQLIATNQTVDAPVIKSSPAATLPDAEVLSVSQNPATSEPVRVPPPPKTPLIEAGSLSENAARSEPLRVPAPPKTPFIEALPEPPPPPIDQPHLSAPSVVHQRLATPSSFQPGPPPPPPSLQPHAAGVQPQPQPDSGQPPDTRPSPGAAGSAPAQLPQARAAEPAWLSTPHSAIPVSPHPPPQAANWTPSAGEVAAVAGGAVVASYQAAQVGTRYLLDFSAWVDRNLRWLRGPALTTLALLIVITPGVGGFLGAGGIGLEVFVWMMAAAFFAVAGLFCLAFVAALRDDDGNWDLGLILRRFKQAGQASWDSASSFVDAPGDRKLDLVTSALMGPLIVLAALLVIPMRFLAMLDLEVPVLDSVAGVCGLLASFVALVRFFNWWNRSAGERPKDQAQRGVASALAATPSFVDLRGNKSLAVELASQAQDPLVRDMWITLGKWRPTGCRMEDEFQGSLHRCLKRHTPETKPERERFIGKGERIDLLLADALAVELKRSYSAGELDRAETQIERYAKAMPVVLLAINATDRAQTRLSERIERLRGMGHHAVLVIFS